MKEEIADREKTIAIDGGIVTLAAYAQDQYRGDESAKTAFFNTIAGKCDMHAPAVRKALQSMSVRIQDLDKAQPVSAGEKDAGSRDTRHRRITTDELHDDKEPITDWKAYREEWDIWEDREETVSVEDPLTILELQPDMYRLVGFKRNMDGSPVFYEFDTEQIRDYVREYAGVDKRKQRDNAQMMHLVLTDPRGIGSKIHNSRIPTTDFKTVRAWEFKPGDVPGLLLRTKKSYQDRIFYGVDTRTAPQTIILKGLFDKKQMENGEHLK